MFTVLNWRALSYSTLINQKNHLCQIIDQLAALLESGQKLVTKTYFRPICSKQAVVFKQKGRYDKMKSQLLKYDHN